LIPPIKTPKTRKTPTTPTPPSSKRWDDIVAPDVKWGPLDVLLGAATTMAIIVAVLSFDAYIEEVAGFTPQGSSGISGLGLLVGVSAVVIGFVIARMARAHLRPLATALLGSGLVISLAYLFASDDGFGSAVFAGVPVSIITLTMLSSSFAATAVAYSLVHYRESLWDPLRALGFIRTIGLKPYIFAALMWMIAISVLMFWIQALVWFDVDLLLPSDTAQKALDEAGGNIIVTIVLVGILGPIAEEVFFRGFVLPGLIRRFGVGRSLLLSSVMFGLFHIDPGAIVPTFALGLALGWVYLKTGSIWPAMFAHGLHNTVAVLAAKYIVTA
jgi:membrane protease YdiL (CAAX protease family)